MASEADKNVSDWQCYMSLFITSVNLFLGFPLFLWRGNSNSVLVGGKKILNSVECFFLPAGCKASFEFVHILAALVGLQFSAVHGSLTPCFPASSQPPECICSSRLSCCVELVFTPLGFAAHVVNNWSFKKQKTKERIKVWTFVSTLTWHLWKATLLSQ